VITETNLGWLAGIADGEGSFYLTATHDRNGVEVIKYSFAVGNTNLKIIQEIKRIYQELLGRQIRFHSIKGRGNRKPSWLIQLTSRGDLQVFCTSILPYIIGKKAQAELMLEFLAIPTVQGANQGGRDETIWQKRLNCVEKMKHLNRYRTGAFENASILANDRTVDPSVGEETVCAA
jgi:hypothetical protein